MNIFDRKVTKKVADAAPVEEFTEKEEQILQEEIPEEPVEEEVAEEDAVEETVSEPEMKSFKITYEGSKYRVKGFSEDDAFNRLLKFFGKEVKEAVEGPSESGKEKFTLTVRDIFNAIAEEISRVVTVAHPECYDQSYDRWISVITEELGEIVHEINDEFEGKNPTKNTFVECVQLCAATILLAKKFAREHSDLFEGDDED